MIGAVRGVRPRNTQPNLFRLYMKNPPARRIFCAAKGRLRGGGVFAGETWYTHTQVIFSHMGNIYDGVDRRMGAIDDDRVVWNVKGEKIGYADDKKIFDVENHLAGWVETDGKIYDADGHHAGYVDPTGAVYDWNAKKVGQSQSPHMELGAAALLVMVLR